MKALFLSICSLVGFLGSVFTLIQYLSQTSRGGEWLKELETRTINLTNLIANLKLSKAVPELREKMWMWARILFAGIIIAALLHSYLLFLIISPTFMLFVIGALALEVISNTKRFIKFHVILITIYFVGVTCTVMAGLQHGSQLLPTLINLARQLGINSPSPVTSMMWPIIASTLFLVAMYLLSMVIFGLIGLGMVLTIWIVVKVSRIFAKRFSRRTLYYLVTITIILASTLCIITFFIS
jgi:hypothetical protein